MCQGREGDCAPGSPLDIHPRLARAAVEGAIEDLKEGQGRDLFVPWKEGQGSVQDISAVLLGDCLSET